MQTHAGGGKRTWNCVSVHTEEEEEDRKRLQNCAGGHAEEEEEEETRELCIWPYSNKTELKRQSYEDSLSLEVQARLGQYCESLSQKHKMYHLYLNKRQKCNKIIYMCISTESMKSVRSLSKLAAS